MTICKDLQNRLFIAEYKNRSIILGKEIEVIRGYTSETAVAIDITENGGLVIKKPNGFTETLNSAEISIRGNFFI